MSELKKHTGSCHCGAVKFTVKANIDAAMACNCSICSRSGHLLAFVPQAHFELLAGKEAMTDYQFGKKKLHHPFCTTCGIRTFSHGVGPTGPMTAINVRCIDGLDVATLKVTHFDGKSLPID